MACVSCRRLGKTRHRQPLSMFVLVWKERSGHPAGMASCVAGVVAGFPQTLDGARCLASVRRGRSRQERRNAGHAGLKMALRHFSGVGMGGRVQPKRVVAVVSIFLRLPFPLTPNFSLFGTAIIFGNALSFRLLPFCRASFRPVRHAVEA